MNHDLLPIGPAAMGLLSTFLALGAASAQAGGAPVPTEPPFPADARQEPPRTTNTPVPAPDFGDRAGWEQRREELRRQILAAAGLLPMPERTPLDPQVFGRVEGAGYTVEKVVLETTPGFFLGASLYRPADDSGKHPAVLTPHGHWQRGRLHSDDRGSIPGRCINLARQGYVVLAYDMVGYNDSDIAIGHGFARDDPRAAPWGVSLFGLQTWDSLRALDFLSSLPDVDPARIGITGASGGGTQTFILCAIDDRWAAAAPVNMISAHFQGGCLCENGPNLRLGTNNVEVGALAAPKPMLMVSCTGDWTANTPSVEGPAVRRAYALYGAEDRLQWVQMTADHNYNQDSREAVYAFFGRHLLGDPDPSHFKEQPFEVPTDEQLRCFPDGKAPEGALGEPDLISRLITDRKAQWEAALPTDPGSLDSFREQYGEALRLALGVQPVEPDQVLVSVGPEGPKGHWLLVLGRRGTGEVFGATLCEPSDLLPGSGVVVVADPGDGGAELQAALLAAGRAVVVVTPFDFTPPRDPRADYYTAYNRTLLAERVQDLLTAVAFARRMDLGPVTLAGTGRAGLRALLACALAPELRAAACDVDGLDTTVEAGFNDELWQPGLRRAGDFRTAAILSAPRPLLLHNTAGKFDASPVEGAYRAVHGDLTVKSEKLSADEVAAWLTAQLRR